MSKKYSPTSISSKMSKSKKDLLEPQQIQKKNSKSSDKQSSLSSGTESDLSESKISLTQQKVMEEAIEKASCLIELLTRQNSESKLYANDLLQELSQLKSKQQELSNANHYLVEQLALSEQQTENLQKQNQQLLFELEKIRLFQSDEINAKEKLEQSKSKSKKLHQKIAFMTKNTIQITKQLEHLKKQYKSLENQNKYLLSELKKSQSKENIFHQNISVKQNLFERKIQDVEATKEAFASRTNELKEENLILLKQIEELRKERYDLEIISRQSMQTLDAVTEKIESYRSIEEKVHRIYQKIKFVMQQGVPQSLIKTQLSVRQKLEQIELLVTYRVQHIENLMKKICERIEKPDWKCNLRELNEAKILAQRLSTYLSELSSKPQMQY